MNELMIREALIVFAKIPLAGQVKTRLTELLWPDEARDLYEAMMLDSLDQYADIGVDLRLYLAPPEVPVPENIARLYISTFWQNGAGLGERMMNAFLETFSAGYARIAIIGTDHPSLPTVFLRHAFDCLSGSASVCIGPSEDGGYYLLGMNEFYPELFTGLEYSHEDVFDQALARIRLTPATSTILPLWYDVDTPEGLRRLILDFESNEWGAKRTRRMVRLLQKRYDEL